MSSAEFICRLSGSERCWNFIWRPGAERRGLGIQSRVLYRLIFTLTPAEEVVPVQVLLLGEHGHHDERVQVDAFAQHPEIVAAQHVHVEEMQHFTADLQRAGSDGDASVSDSSHRSSRRRRNAHVLMTDEFVSARLMCHR